jgi:biopolymer transport protein ExbB
MYRQRLVKRAVWSWVALVAAWSVVGLATWATPAAAQDNTDEGTAVTEQSGNPQDTAPPKEEKKQENMLVWVIHTSGWIGLVLLLLSIYFVATCVRMFLELRSEVAAPLPILQECENLLKAKDLMGMYKLVKQDNSFFSAVMAAGLAELQHGLPEARDAIERVGDAQVVEMEKKISMLAVLGTLGPMIGLLGTLKGMIASFSVIAMSGTQLDAGEVAGGISEALVLTFEGVALSVPAIYFFALFRNRIASISTEVLLVADEMIRRVNAVLRPKPGQGSTTTTA